MRYADLLCDDILRVYAGSLNRRAKALGRESITVDAIRDRILASGGQCEWCGVSLVGQDFELDHLVSLREGGAHEGDNLVVACPACNRRKGTKAPIRFALEIVAEVGRRTSLVAHVLKTHEAEGRVQKSLFGDDGQDDDDGSDGYRW